MIRYALLMNNILNSLEDYDGAIERLQDGIEDLLLLNIEENGTQVMYHFKAFEPKKCGVGFDYVFYKYSTERGFKFLKDNTKYKFLVKLLFLEIQEVIDFRNVYIQLNSDLV